MLPVNEDSGGLDVSQTPFKLKSILHEFVLPEHEQAFRQFMNVRERRQIIVSAFFLMFLSAIGYAIDFGREDFDAELVFWPRLLAGIFCLAVALYFTVANTVSARVVDLAGVLLMAGFVFGHCVIAVDYFSFSPQIDQSFVFGVFILVSFLVTYAPVRFGVLAGLVIFLQAGLLHVFYLQTEFVVLAVMAAIWLAAIVVGYGLASSGHSIRRHDFALLSWLNEEVENRKKVEQDITAYRNALENRIVQQNQELRDSERQLIHAQRMESMGQLSGGIAHDFNNILTIILGYTDLSKRAVDKAELIACQEQIEKAANRAAVLADQLLSFSRRKNLQTETVDLNQLIEHLQRMLRPLIPESVSLRTIGSDQPVFVDANSGQIDQVLMNLIINARDAMPAGGDITVSLVIEKLTAEAAVVNDNADMSAGDYAVLSVQDTGSGIDPSELKLIFEPFYSTKAEGEGTGLGLSVVRSIVRNHRGALHVVSNEQEGTCFKLYLEISDAEIEMPSDTELGKQILIVEGEAASREVDAAALRAVGYGVTESCDCGSAIELLCSGQKFSAVLVDLEMPEISGGELRSMIRDSGSIVPFLFTSKFGDRSNVISTMEELNVIVKPYTPEKLTQRMQELIGAVEGEKQG